MYRYWRRDIACSEAFSAQVGYFKGFSSIRHVIAFFATFDDLVHELIFFISAGEFACPGVAFQRKHSTKVVLVELMAATARCAVE